MPKRKKKLKKPRLYSEGKMYVSPDGGETVYEQKRDGTRGPLISQSELAKDVEMAQEEIEMHGVYALQMILCFYMKFSMGKNHNSRLSV